MKKMKKLVSLLLTLAMVLALAVPAFAATTTVNNNTGYDYKAYQIFKGTQTATEANGEIVVTGWGDGIVSNIESDSSFLTGLQKIFGEDFTYAADLSYEAVASELQKEGFDSARARKFAKFIETFTDKNSNPVLINNNTSTTLETGYYLLVNEGTIGSDSVRGLYLLDVTGNGSLTITPKVKTPSVEKKIWEESLDVDKSKTGVASNKITEFVAANFDPKAVQWNDVGDYDIGDSIPYLLTATIPAGTVTDEYETYSIVFEDSMASVLENNKDYKVFYQFADGAMTELSKPAFTVTDETATGFHLKVTDVKTLQTPYPTETELKVYVVFTAKLSAAAQSAIGYENEVTLKFSNDFTNSGDGHTPNGSTGPDVVVALTYKFEVNKTDAAENALAGAEFDLYKVTNATAFNDQLTTTKTGTDNRYALVNTDGLTKVNDASFTSSETERKTLNGLDTGTYILVETKAPDGYNASTKAWKIVIKTTDYIRDNYTTGGHATKLYVVELDGVEESDKIINIKNNKGGTLPETGGVGTTLFYLFGGLLTAGAVVVLITRKRMGASK